VCSQSAGVVNGDQAPLNLSVVVGVADRRTSGDVIDEKPEVTRRRKAELMTSLRLADSSAPSGRCDESPMARVELSTDWNGEHLLYDPPPTKRRRTDDEKEEKAEEEKETEEEKELEDASKKGRSALLSVLAACSFTDIYNAYQRRQARLQAEVSSAAGNAADSVAGSGLTAEVDDHVDDTTLDTNRKSSCDSGAFTEDELTDREPPSDNGVYPLAAR